MMFALAVALAGPVVDGATAPVYAINNGAGKATLLHNATTGASAAALGVLELSGGAVVPPHRHEGSAEMLYVLEGTVTMTIGAETLTARAGDAIYIPAGIEHSATATSFLRCVQVYVGPGPEQRFTTGTRIR